MTIGIDLSPLQGPHRMRGIGYTVLNLINNLPDDIRSKHQFVFYVFPEQHSLGNPLELLDTHGLDYEVRELRPRRRFSYKLPGRLYLLNSVGNQLVELKDLYFGDSRISTVRGLDVFLQTDQSQSLPRRGRTKKALILYDVIPYVLEWDYLWSYRTARRLHGFSRKAAFRCQVRRWLYAHKLRVNVRRAKLLLSISEQTKSDFVRLLSTSPKKIMVVPLGVSRPTEHTGSVPAALSHYRKTGWGYLQYPLELDLKVPFLLFVGGADKRRKLEDLITAFNNLRAQGYELKLVLAGDSMKGPENISTEQVQTALKDSSYISDIIFMGFVDDIGRDWLYKNALGFVFPSRYEGFGLPVLEALIHGCPVISYKNGATLETAGDAPVYAKDAESLRLAILELLAMPPKQKGILVKKGLAQSQQYDWVKTSRKIFTALNGLV